MSYTLTVQQRADGTWIKTEDVGFASAKRFDTIDQIAEELVRGKKDYPKGVKVGTTLVIKLRKDRKPERSFVS